MEKGCTDRPSRETRHLGIDNALDRVEDSIGNLRNLRFMIAGDSQGKSLKDPKNTKAQISLKDFLSSASDRLHDLNSQLVDEINQIKEMLF